jgi:hypothetical protein
MSSDPLPTVIQDEVFRALGYALARVWARLPQDVQHDLFEDAVASRGEGTRQELAVFLHHAHSRTGDAVRSQAASEPDSLGG